MALINRKSGRELLERRRICCAQYDTVDSNNVEGRCHDKLLFKIPRPLPAIAEGHLPAIIWAAAGGDGIG